MIGNYLVKEIKYSKKVSDTVSGKIVSKKGENFLVLNYPELEQNEEKLINKLLMELKFLKTKIEKKSDIYFFLKNYCIENNILLKKEPREKILQLLEWETLGNSILTPLLEDERFEEIVINGSEKPVMVYHNIFGWLTSNTYFCSDEKIKNLINKLVSKLGRQLSYNSPLLNATLEDGSRINATMDPIAFSGINATIRKFKKNPLTPSNIIKSRVISSEAMAFLWLAIQSSCSLLVCGNTGSGKTTTLNSLFCFLPSNERIIVVEETPEIVLPQRHKIKLNTAEQLRIGLNELIENTFRMRPDRVIVGEIRGEKEAKAYINTMLAGQAKGSYATFHSESTDEALQRLESFNIEKNSLKSIDIIIVQKRISKINLKKGVRIEERKVTEICELGKKGINVLFKFNWKKEKLEKINNSIRAKNKIVNTFGFKEKEYVSFLKEKKKVLEKLNDISFNEFFELAEND